MLAIKSRLNKLERRMGIGAVQGAIVVVKGGQDSQALDSLLLQSGIDPDDASNTIVILSNQDQPEILFMKRH